MKPKKDQHKTGIRTKPRGQQMGTAGARDQNRAEMENTPARRRSPRQRQQNGRR